MHVMVSCEDSIQSLEECWLAALREAGVPPENTVMRRVFCSNVANQFPQLDSFSRAYPGGFSAIGQTPMAGGQTPFFPASGPVTGSFNGPHPKSNFLAIHVVDSAKPVNDMLANQVPLLAAFRLSNPRINLPNESLSRANHLL